MLAVYWRRNSRQDRAPSLDVLDKDLDLSVDQIDPDLLDDSRDEVHAMVHPLSSRTAGGDAAPADSPASADRSSAAAAAAAEASSQAPRVPSHQGPVELNSSFLANSLLHHLMQEEDGHDDQGGEGSSRDSNKDSAEGNTGAQAKGDGGGGDGDDHDDNGGDDDDDDDNEGGIHSMRIAYSSLSQNPVLHSEGTAKNHHFHRAGFGRRDHRRKPTLDDEGGGGGMRLHASGWRVEDDEGGADTGARGLYRDRADTEVSLPEHHHVVAAHEVQARKNDASATGVSSSATTATFAMGHGALVQRSQPPLLTGLGRRRGRGAGAGGSRRHAGRYTQGDAPQPQQHGARNRSSSFQTALEQAGVEVGSSFDFVPDVSTSHGHADAFKVSPLGELTKPSPLGLGAPSSVEDMRHPSSARSKPARSDTDDFLLGAEGDDGEGSGDVAERGTGDRGGVGMDRTASMDEGGHLSDQLLHSPTMRPRLGSELPLLDDPWRSRGHEGMGTLEDSLRWMGGSPPVGSNDSWSDDRRGGRDRSDTMGQLLDRDQEVDQYHRESRQGGSKPLGTLQMMDSLREQIVAEQRRKQQLEADDALSLDRSDSEKMPPPRRQTSDSSSGGGSRGPEWPVELGGGGKGNRSKKPQTPRARRSGPTASRRSGPGAGGAAAGAATAEAKKGRGSSSGGAASPRARSKGARSKDDDGGTDDEDDRAGRSRSAAKPLPGAGAAGGARALPALITREERPRGWVGSYPPEMRRERIQRCVHWSIDHYSMFRFVALLSLG